MKTYGLFALSIALTGCGREDISVYTVPKETPAPAVTPAAQPDTATAPQLKWRLPAGWKEGAPSEFRLASFRIKAPNGKEADVSVVPLPGAAGGDLSNVNRWRNQVSLPPVTEAELAKLALPVTVGDQPAQLYDQAGDGANGDPTRILAVIQRREGTAWFFKMTGDKQLVADQKPIFVEFLKTLQIGTSGLPAGHPDMAAAQPPATTAPISNEGKPKWSPPADWQEVAGGQFLVAKFLIAGGQAAVNVSTSAGNGGGLTSNVNRWRKQLGLSELSADELAKSVQKAGDQISFVEMSGTDARSGKPAALVGALVFQPDHAWFYKLMGDAPVVAAQKDAFMKFVREVQY